MNWIHLLKLSIIELIEQSNLLQTKSQKRRPATVIVDSKYNSFFQDQNFFVVDLVQKIKKEDVWKGLQTVIYRRDLRNFVYPNIEPSNVFSYRYR